MRYRAVGAAMSTYAFAQLTAMTPDPAGVTQRPYSGCRPPPTTDRRRARRPHRGPRRLQRRPSGFQRCSSRVRASPTTGYLLTVGIGVAVRGNTEPGVPILG